MRTTLLERIAALETVGSNYFITSHENRVKNSVKNYLERLLNTRRGDCRVDPHYGLPDMKNIAGSLLGESNKTLEQSILEQILLYEKRLIQPSISRLQDVNEVMVFLYEIRGMINISELGTLMRSFVMELRLNSAGRIAIKEKSGF
jgi:type VI secretion system protein